MTVDNPNEIDVVAAVIFSADRRQLLLARRKPEQHQGNRWEFPGGKLEAGEDAATGLSRELLEELGIVPTISEEFHSLTYCYTDKTVHLYFRTVKEFSGEPCGREGQEVRWVTLAELPSLQFPDANREVVNLLLTSVL